MLLQIREYMRQEKIATNQQIARAMQIDIQALQPMLDLWVCRGVLQKQSPDACKTACFKCPQKTPVYYIYP